MRFSSTKRKLVLYFCVPMDHAQDTSEATLSSLSSPQIIHLPCSLRPPASQLGKHPFHTAQGSLPHRVLREDRPLTGGPGAGTAHRTVNAWHGPFASWQRSNHPSDSVQRPPQTQRQMSPVVPGRPRATYLLPELHCFPPVFLLGLHQGHLDPRAEAPRKLPAGIGALTGLHEAHPVWAGRTERQGPSSSGLTAGFKRGQTQAPSLLQLACRGLPTPCLLSKLCLLVSKWRGRGHHLKAAA